MRKGRGALSLKPNGKTKYMTEYFRETLNGDQEEELNGKYEVELGRV